MVVQTWTEVLAVSLQQLWSVFVGFLPALLGALLVFVLGLVVASGLGMLVKKLVVAIKLDAALVRAGVEPYFKRAGLRIDLGEFFGKTTYWFILIAFFLAAADILHFGALSLFLRAVLLYIPQVIVAVLIMLVAVILAKFFKKLVEASVMSAELHSANFLGSLTWWSVIIFGLFAALTQLGIAVAIINTFVTGFVVMVALAGGIAFGLGGKDYASHLIRKLRDQVEDK